MIAYFDTSAVVPLLVDEPGSAAAAALWDAAGRRVSVRLVYPEARAALAHAHRLGRLTAHHLYAAVAGLSNRYDELDLVEIDDPLARHAGELAQAHHLRGYDAIHLAAADRVGDDDLVLVAGDRALLTAAAAAGMSTAAVA